jgi:uncharacterized protein (TIGR02145 family)
MSTGPGCCNLPGASGILFSAFNPCASAPDTSIWTLIDDRDNKTYKVKKLADGRYWMAENLAFGDCGTGTFKNDYTLANASATPTVASGYAGHCRTSTGTNGGYLYSWAAAMNNPYGYSGSLNQTFPCTGKGSSANTCRGICPEGWHVPTKDEFSSANTAFGSAYSCAKENCWNTTSKWEGALGGYCASSGTMNQVNSYGAYWSSSYSSGANAFALRFYTNTLYDGTATIAKNVGQSVRCVKNY